MQNADRKPPENRAPLRKADLPDGNGQLGRLVVELYEEPDEASAVPIVIMVPKGVPYSALHD